MSVQELLAEFTADELRWLETAAAADPSLAERVARMEGVTVGDVLARLGRHVDAARARLAVVESHEVARQARAIYAELTATRPR